MNEISTVITFVVLQLAKKSGHETQGLPEQRW
jgi:hypothetical protein